MSPFRSLLACIVLTAASGGIADEATAPPVEASRPVGWRLQRKPTEARKPLPPVPLLIERLGSPRFVERAAATRDLARGGERAVPALRDAALSDDPEVSIRAVAALEDLWLRAMEGEDEATASSALAALDDLSAAEDRALRSRVEALLGAYAPLIEKYAMNEIRRLGGTLKHVEGVYINNDDGSMRPQVQHAVIGTKWTGGEAGLRHLRRLRRDGRLAVYIISEADLPEGAFERFQAMAGDEMAVTLRGASYLGVQSGQVPIQGIDGCLVTGVEPETPAAKAGVMRDDVFVEFNGKKIGTFDQLVEEIKRTQPGQTVEATVLRQGVPVELEITMEEWQ